TASSARKLGMGTDVALASAWPFGGPNVTPAMAARKLAGGKLLSATGGEAVDLSVFKKGSGTLLALVAYTDSGRSIDLTKYVDSNGILHFTFPSGLWDVYSLLSEPTGQMVKRSGVGGEGLVLDHFN